MVVGTETELMNVRQVTDQELKSQVLYQVLGRTE